MEPDGSDVRRLTEDPASDGAPAYSPDGTEVAFSRYRDGVRELFVVGADGSGLRQLTDHPGAEPGHEYWDHDPAFSPDGTKIAFSRAERSVYVMGADGSDPVRLAEGTTRPSRRTARRSPTRGTGTSGRWTPTAAGRSF